MMDPQIAIDRLREEAITLQHLLTEFPASHDINRISLEMRLERISEELNGLEASCRS